jgi:50S ribosomal protein L16 3-hydroxylase
MITPRLQFGEGLSRQAFLDTCWQRRPALLRAAIDVSACRLTPDELAGLACEEEDVESRLIQQFADREWSLRHGPFEEQDFASLPPSHWTLLVQDVDKHVPEVAELLDAFDFLPDWRIDDIMISYAADHGGVGPHTDNYDVFLIQVEGRRRWQISERHYTERDLLSDCPLRVLREFHAEEDWLLEPGDVLYLPPGVAHWGTAVGDCMTWSVGMRGASDTELAAAWLEQLPLHQGRPHLGDSISSQTDAPSLLGQNDIGHVLDTMAGALPGDSPAFRRWLGAYLTEPKPGFEIPPVDDAGQQGALLAQWRTGAAVLRRHPWARFALIHIDAERIALCSQGEVLEQPTSAMELLQRLCRHRTLSAEDFRDAGASQVDALVTDLLKRGWLYRHE